MSLVPAKLTVAALKEELTKRGVDIKSLKLKADLVAALEEAIGEGSPAPVEPEKPAKRAARGKKAAAAKEESDDEEEDEKPAKRTARNKKRKAEEVTEEPEDTEEKEEAEKPSAPKRQKGTPKVDKCLMLPGAVVVVDGDEIFDVMLNQVNIKQNNNKFYVIQMVKAGAFYVFTRWGRVGEDGQNQMFGPFGAIAAAKGQFEKKFKDKTGQAWSKTIRDNFVPRSNKYTLLEMEYDDDVPEGPIVVGDKKVTVRPSKLDPVVQEFVKLISDSDMFKQQMQAKGIDVHRMPLGKLSQSTVKKGLEALNSISRVLKGEEKGDVKDLSSVFYTNIPHAHGRGSALPTITAETLQQKIDLVNMLGDIAIAQSLLSGADAKTTGDEVDHPTDVHYKALNADLTSVKPGSSEFDYIKTYMDNTQPGHLKLLEVLKVNRHPEGDRYKEHDDLDNRKLLWHGTNVAVVVAILKSGLRIMPHSGGRVGRGIYLADENSKSAGYVGRTSDGIGMMFLCEAVLGKEHHINRDDSSLRAAPKGFDSVIAKGWKMPNPKDDIEVDFDGRKVTVPQGKSTNTEYSGNSSFSQNEYLVYRESQVRIRYVLKIQWPKGNAWY